MDYLGRWSSWADLPPPLPPAHPLLRLQGFRVALIPLSLPSPTDPKASPWSAAGPGEHPPKLFPEIQAWKTGVGLQVLARSPHSLPCWEGLFEECGAETDSLNLASEGVLMVQKWLVQGMSGVSSSFHQALSEPSWRMQWGWRGWGRRMDCPSLSLSFSTLKTLLSASSAPNPGSYHNQLQLPALLRSCVLFILGTLCVPLNILRTVYMSLDLKS